MCHGVGKLGAQLKEFLNSVPDGSLAELELAVPAANEAFRVVSGVDRVAQRTAHEGRERNLLRDQSPLRASVRGGGGVRGKPASVHFGVVGHRRLSPGRGNRFAPDQ
jgi:hypothetical protein